MDIDKNICYFLSSLWVGIIMICNMVFLVKDYDVYNTCDNSSLWIYIIAITLITYIRDNILKYINFDNQIEVFYIFTLWGIIEFIMTVWGGIELHSVCDDMYRLNIWKFNNLLFILQCISTIIFMTPLIARGIHKTISYVEEYFEDNSAQIYPSEDTCDDTCDSKESDIEEVRTPETPKLSPLVLDVSSPCFSSPDKHPSSNEMKSIGSQETVKVVDTNEDQYKS